jgi:thiol-disulfide isomerase/thioredoxin
MAAATVLVAGWCFALDADLPRKAPELQYTLPGKGPQLLSALHGKVVALEFILTTCPHCQAASRIMSDLQRQYGPAGFQALDVAINATDMDRTPAQADTLVESFANQFQVAFPVGYATRDQMVAFMGFSLADRFVVPQIVLIDRNGVIHYQTPPLGDEHSQEQAVLQQRIQELLAIPAAGSKRPVSKKLPTHKTT